MFMKLSEEVIKKLKDKGVECLHGAGVKFNILEDVIFEPPCSLKWLRPEFDLKIGAYSYVVSGYACAVSIERYCSIGEDVQIGRQDHPLNWISTSPFQYLKEKMFDVGDNFLESKEYHNYVARPPFGGPSTFKRTFIGNDVWIGHGAYIRSGVSIGDGAVVGAQAVVTRDVAPYAVVVGNPARVVKFRVPEDLIAEFLRIRWWRFAPWQLGEVPFHDPHGALAGLDRIASSSEPYQPDVVRLRHFCF